MLTDLEEILIENIKNYGMKQAFYAVEQYMIHGDASACTRINGAREKLQTISREQIKKDIIEIYKRNHPSAEKISIQEACAFYVARTVLHYRKSMQKSSYQANIYADNISKCYFQEISGLTHEKEGDLELANGTLIGSTRIEKKEKNPSKANQEDAFLLMVHPQNPKFKMLLIADGMGGLEKGEQASHIVIQELKKWFYSLDITYFSRMENIKKFLDEKIIEISEKLQHNQNMGGSTMVSAIVGEKDTLVSNVGDSRAYIYQNKQLTQLSQDDSWIDSYFIEEEFKRFHIHNNVITQCIGDNYPPKVHHQIISNQEYEKILLFSDGVTDCLSDEQILGICKTTDRKKLAHKLVEKALTTNTKLPDALKGNDLYRPIIRRERQYDCSSIGISKGKQVEK